MSHITSCGNWGLYFSYQWDGDKTPLSQDARSTQNTAEYTADMLIECPYPNYFLKLRKTQDWNMAAIEIKEDYEGFEGKKLMKKKKRKKIKKSRKPT